MRKLIDISPPENFASFSPSELFKFYFQIGHWTEESFSDEFQTFTRGKLVSTVTINQWKNKNVIPTRYSGAFLNMIASAAHPNLAKQWVTAFETVWALHTAGRTQDSALPDKSKLSDRICVQHRNWIKQLYYEKHPKQSFSYSDIYVPIQVSEINSYRAPPQDIEDIIDMCGDWRFVSGKAGAGKSMAALHLAQTLCEGDIFPIFIRGNNLSYIEIDVQNPNQPIGDAFSVKSFLKHFRSSTFENACVILDGLDEINLSPQGGLGTLNRLVDDLKLEQTACAAHGKVVQIVAFGRQAHISVSVEHGNLNEPRCFALRALDGSCLTGTASDGAIQGQDLRNMWWDKYLKANGYESDPSLPDFLSTEYDDFFEFGRDALLSFLICQSSLEDYVDSSPNKLPHERVNALTYNSNRNEIYKTIINHQTKSLELPILQQIALAAWHQGDSQTISLEHIYERSNASRTQKAIQSQDPLVTGFYSLHAQNGKEVIEFSHKSFAEYFTATLVLDTFIALISAYCKSLEFEDALKEWIRISSKGAHEPSLANFCQNEAAIWFESISDLNWDAALTICRDHMRSTNFAGQEGHVLSQMQHASSLLFFIWSCFNLEHRKRTGTAFLLSNDNPQFNVDNLKAIQRPNGLNFKSGSINDPILRDLTFLTPSLSALHLKSADMSQLSFSRGHIESLTCEDTSLAMTHWSHVKITTAQFMRTMFQHVIFHHGRIVDSQLSHCLFQGSRFQGTTFSDCEFKETFFSQCHFTEVEFITSDFRNVIFDRCLFYKCIFSFASKNPPTIGLDFRHCTFMDMDRALNNIPSESITNSISEIKI